MTTLTNRQALLYRGVQISLFSWRRAEPDDKLDDDQRMGWWGDSFPPVANDRIGSRLWQLRRRTLVPEVLRLAEEFAHEALRWMVEDELATDIAVQASKDDRERLNLVVVLSDESGALPPFPFNDIWRVIDAV